MLTIFFVFFFYLCVSYTFTKYSDFCENENIFRFWGYNKRVRNHIEEELRQQILQHKSDNKVLHVKNFISDIHSWEESFSHLNEMIKRVDEGLGNSYVIDLGGTTIGGVNFWQPLTMTIDQASSKHFSKLDSYIEKLKLLHPHNYYGCFSIISLTDSEKTYMHNDPVDVFYIQQIGKVNWEITQEGQTSIYTLESGDMIFVPADILHEIKSLEPRTALSFMFYRDERNKYR